MFFRLFYITYHEISSLNPRVTSSRFPGFSWNHIQFYFVVTKKIVVLMTLCFFFRKKDKSFFSQSCILWKTYIEVHIVLYQSHYLVNISFKFIKEIVCCALSKRFFFMFLIHLHNCVTHHFITICQATR